MPEPSAHTGHRIISILNVLTKVIFQVPVAHGKADINIYRKAGEKVVNVLSKRYRWV